VRTITKALGYQTYNLYGISYGTKLALETMRVAPDGIRSVVIDGVAPPWVKLYETLTLKIGEAMRTWWCNARPMRPATRPILIWTR
jgi:pimeloyl-ACP methyl ester carboxylesterase